MNSAADPMALVLAAEAGDLREVRRLVAEGVSIEQPDHRESSRLQTPLMRASASAHVDVVQTLLAAGAEVNARSADRSSLTQGEKMMLYHTSPEELEEAGIALGWTALHLATKADAVAVMDLLLEAGADVEAETLFEARPIHTAVDSKSLAALTRLLAAGASVNARGFGRSTALHEAASWGADALLELLVQAKNIKVDLKDRDGHTALMLAIEHGQRRCVELLLEAGAGVEIKDRHGKTAADYAQEAGGKVRSLFFANSRSRQPALTNEQLHSAVQNGDLETIQDAIEHGLDLEQRHGDWALLPTAVLHANPQTVQKLVDAGVDVEQKNGLDGAEEYQGATGLMMTFVGNISNKKAEAIRQILLQAGADVNTTNACGWTPLMYVATYAEPDYVRKCLEIGADPSFQTEYGETALSALQTEWLATQRLLMPSNEETFRRRFQEVREILLAAGGVDRPEIESTALEAVIANKDDSVVPELLKSGLNPDIANRQGTLLQQCLFLGLHGSAASLLEAGADAARVTPGNPMPPIFSAVSIGDASLVKLILERGISPLLSYEEQGILNFLPRHKESRAAIRELLVAAEPSLAVTKAGLGVSSFDLNYGTLLVKAAGRRVAQAIARLVPDDARQWQPREGIPAISGFLVLTWTDRVNPVRWATIHPLRAPKTTIHNGEFAQKLSAEVKNDVILFRNSDTAGWLGYDYFKKGKRVERFQLFPEDSISLDGDSVFESSLRNAKLPAQGQLLSFVHESFVEFGAYVPPFEEIHDLGDATELLREHFVVKIGND